MHIVDFLFKKELKIKESNQTEGPDFAIEHKGKNINIEVITLSNPSDKNKKKHCHKNDDDNFYNEYKIPKTQIMIKQGELISISKNISIMV